MTEKEIQYWELIVKEQADIIGDKDQQILNSWKNENPDQYRQLLEIHRSTDGHDTAEFNPEKTWNEFKTMIRIEEEEKSAKTIRLFPWIARAAASVIIILGVIYIYQYQSSTNEQAVIQTLVSAGVDDQKQVELPDGSVVWLNKGSELLYPENFYATSREVYLKGEAYFDVAHNQEKPFIVHAGISKTTVIGTSFNLRAYGKEDDIRLTVVSGKVAFTLTDDRERVIVTPGNMANLNRNSKSIVHGENPDLNFLSWKTKELKFNDCPISELITALERYYGIDIQLQNEATNNCRFTGDFKDTELDNTLKIITRAIGSEYKKTGTVYMINGEGCN